MRLIDLPEKRPVSSNSIKAKLLEMGWERSDFPMDNKEFRGLVLKDQKLTPKSGLALEPLPNPLTFIVVWKNIKWKLEPLLETSRNERLEREKRQRRRSRENAIRAFYHQIAQKTMGDPFQNSRVGSILPKTEEILALPSIQLLLEEDTETVTEGQWSQVAPDVQYIVTVWWRDTLEQLVDSLERDTGNRPHEASKGDEETLNSTPEKETEGAILASIEALKIKLSSVRSVFCCSDRHPRKLYWFPHNITHGLSGHNFSSRSDLLDKIRPLDAYGQHLVRRLLTDLRLDPEMVRSSEVVYGKQTPTNFLCTRCDEKVARYMSLKGLVRSDA